MKSYVIAIGIAVSALFVLMMVSGSMQADEEESDPGFSPYGVDWYAVAEDLDRYGGEITYVEGGSSHVATITKMHNVSYSNDDGLVRAVSVDLRPCGKLFTPVFDIHEIMWCDITGYSVNYP